MRHPKIIAACLAFERRVRRDGVPNYEHYRANEAASPFDVTADRGDGVTVVCHRVPVEDADIEVAVYRDTASPPGPVHLLMHGGAFCYGDYRNVDVVARELAAVGVVVVSVAYRLAPEHPFPAPLEDCYAALRWAAQSSELLHSVPGRLSVGGASAGANLAAALSLLARDRHGPAISCQVLEIPLLDLTMTTSPTMRRYARGYLSNNEHLFEHDDYYVPDRARRADPYASPLLAGDLTGLPPAVILTAEYDTLRDQGEEYGRRLRAAGVPVETIRARGQVHPSVHSSMPSAARYRRSVAESLARAHGLPAPR